jgi:hypothetical protein
MTRKDFLDTVVLLFNIQKSSSNIKDTEGRYIHFIPDAKDTYKLTPELMLGKEEDDKLTPELILEKEEDETKKYNPKQNYNNFFNKYIKIDDHKIPYIYLFINQQEIFNFIIMSFSCSSLYCENNENIFKTIFNFSPEDLSFIGMSYRFNIFNVSLFTNTFFKIVKFILDNILFEESKQKKKLISSIISFLKGIYENKNTIINLYDLISYIKSLYTIKNIFKTDCDNFKLSDTILFTEMTPSQEEQCWNIIKNKENINKEAETEEEEKKEYDKIIFILANQILLIIKILYIIQKLFNNNEIAKVFLFAILSYRLTNRYIFSTWAFSPKFIYDYFSKNISNELEPDELKLNELELNKDNKDNKKPYFINTYTPLNIVDYTRVSYKGTTFTNCVENAFLQFIKVIFWDDENGKYDENKINIKIREEYKETLSKILQESKNNNETSESFSNEWITFLYSLIPIPNSEKFVGETCELYSNITNLCEFLYNLFNINIIKEITFNEFISQIDENITINCSNCTMENIKLNDGSIIIDSLMIDKSNSKLLLTFKQYILQITNKHSAVINNCNKIPIDNISITENYRYSILIKYHNIVKYKYFLQLLLLENFNIDNSQQIYSNQYSSQKLVFAFIVNNLSILDLYIDLYIDNITTEFINEEFLKIFFNGLKEFLAYCNLYKKDPSNYTAYKHYIRYLFDKIINIELVNMKKKYISYTDVISIIKEISTMFDITPFSLNNGTLI